MIATRPTYYECGICGAWHSATWDGDCREDAARFYPDELDARYGLWDSIEMEEISAWRMKRIRMT